MPLPLYFARLAAMVSSLLFSAFFAAPVALGDDNVLISRPVESGSGSSSFLRWDRNGRYAVFLSIADNLVPDQDTNGRNVFLYDRLAGSVRLVSHLPGLPATGANNGVTEGFSPSISADGNWVAYTSDSTDLVAGQDDTNQAPDVFLWSRESDVTQLVSHRSNAAAAAGNNNSAAPRTATPLSDDGRFVVYESLATDLVAGQQTNSFKQIYQFDRTTGASELVSHAASSALQSANNHSSFPSQNEGRVVSGDGRLVVFVTLATNLRSGITDSNGVNDVYRWDRRVAPSISLRLLSRRSGAPSTTASGTSERSVISADGSAVAFLSIANNVEGAGSDGNGTTDVFRYDEIADQVELVSHSAQSAATTGNGSAQSPSISGDGRAVGFLSDATNHVAQQQDLNVTVDVFLWRSSGIVLVSHVAGSPTETGNGLSDKVIVAENGSGVAFQSQSTDLVAAVDGNAVPDVYWRPLAGPDVLLVSHVPDGSVTGAGISQLNDVAVGGALIGFHSVAENLVPAASNFGSDVFAHGSLVMADGFESGDLTAWSQHIP
jgi:Tol biopolymer transport system component